MKNYLSYYYNLNPDKIINTNRNYYFYLDDERYELVVYNRNSNEINSIYKLNKELTDKTLMHKIILNKNNNITSIINNIPYILYKVYININKEIPLEEISYLSNINIKYEKELMRSNWAYLWSKNIDYFEYQISQNGKKYPLIVNSFSYFVGMAENSISYINNTSNELSPSITDVGVLSHKKIRNSDTIYSLYNPLNIIIDHKARDLSEYIKLSFLKKNKDIFDELDEYFKHNYFSHYGIRLLFGRILYPSFYFDLYEDIINDEQEEKEIIGITSRINEYEDYLYDVFYYLKKFYNLPEVEWITKKLRFNPR